MTREEKAIDFFKRGANCAQAVAGAFADVCGISEEEAFRISSGFGGGVGRMREVCGAVCGMVLVLNMKFGSADIENKDAKDAQYAVIQKLTEQFKAECGAIVCRELLGLSPAQPLSPVSDSRTREFYQKRPCAETVAIAVRITENFLNSR